MRTRPTHCRAFSLLELIVVILIIGIIAAFVTPAATTILRGSQLTQATQILTDQIALARQLAVTKNVSVEVRFIRYKDPEVPGDKGPDGQDGAFRALQVFEVLDSGKMLPMDKPQLLPQSIVMSSGELSTLLNHSSMKPAKKPDSKNDPELPRNIKHDYEYVSFRFLPDGSTNLHPQTELWYVTIHNMNDLPKDSKPPANFFTLQIDPVSGTTKFYRPGV